MIDFLNSAAGVVTTLSILAAFLVAVVGWLLVRGRRWAKDGVAVRDVLLGRDEIVDSITGAQIAPPLLGIGARMSAQETITAEIAAAIRQMAGQQGQLDDHERRLKAIEGGGQPQVVIQQTLPPASGQ